MTIFCVEVLSKLFIRRINESVSLLSFNFGVSCIDILVDSYPVVEDDIVHILLESGENGVKWGIWSADVGNVLSVSTACAWLNCVLLLLSPLFSNKKLVCCKLDVLSDSNGGCYGDGVRQDDDGIIKLDLVSYNNDLELPAKMFLFSYVCDLSSCCLSFHIYCFLFSAWTVARSASHSACVS